MPLERSLILDNRTDFCLTGSSAFGRIAAQKCNNSFINKNPGIDCNSSLRRRRVKHKCYRWPSRGSASIQSIDDLKQNTNARNKLVSCEQFSTMFLFRVTDLVLRRTDNNELFRKFLHIRCLFFNTHFKLFRQDIASGRLTAW